MSLKARYLEQTYTPEEFEALPEFDGRYELVDGRIIEKPMPGDEHGAIIRRLITFLVLLDPTGKLGAWWTQTNVNFGDGWLPAPDFTFITFERVPSETSGAIKATPDLVVEVHSPSDLDSKPGREAAQNKIKKYQAHKVKLVWAINPRTQTVQVYHPGSALPFATLGVEDELTGEDVIPGFQIKVRALFH